MGCAPGHVKRTKTNRTQGSMRMGWARHRNVPIGAARGRLPSPVSRPGGLGLLSLTDRVLGARTSRSPTRDCGEPSRRWAGVGMGFGMELFLARSGALSGNEEFLERQGAGHKRKHSEEALDRWSQSRNSIERSREFLVGRVRVRGVKVSSLVLQYWVHSNISPKPFVPRVQMPLGQ